MKTMKKALALMLAFVLVMGTAVVGFDGILALKASAAGEFNLKADASGNFKILQVADIQDSWKANGTVNGWERTVEMIEAAVTLKKPDLIVMTGDNIGPEDSGDRLTSRSDFEYSVQRIVDCFHGVPFVVTYGNHDYERNTNGSKNISLSDQDQIYHSHGALTLNQTGLTISSSSANSTARYGTGYLDVYDSTGTNVIERVIVLNSGNYEGSRSPAQYGRVGVNNDDYTQYDYQNVVNAVNSWTSDTSIKCIAFEHIPIQEMFYGDSASTSICKEAAGGYSIYPSNTGRITSKGSYKKNDSNTTVTGEFHENAGQAYGSTRELFDALAGKSNVAGLFFGHEHTNTVTGVATIGGKTLRMGYGGGMLVYTDYVGDSAYADNNPLASFYTLNKDYNGVNDTAHFSKDVLTYFGITRDANNKDLYSNNQKYISDVRLFVANTPNATDTSGPGYFSEAVENCIAAGYTPIEDTYTQNTLLDGKNYVQIADFNFDSYSWDAWTNARAVCLGYKTTTDPNEAITDIRILTGSTPGATYTNQELWQNQNNSAITCQNTRNTTGTNSPVITYYNANYDNNGSSLRTDTNGAQIKFNDGLNALGASQNTWLFYTKDYRAGLPVKSLFTNITSTYKVAGKEKPFTGTDGFAMYTNLNLNKNNNEYPYSWVQYLNDTSDLAWDMAAANVKMNYTNKLLGGDKQTASWGFIGMTHALPTDEDLLSANVVSTVSPVAVPETVYLTSAASAMTDFQTAVNNVMTISNGVKVALQPADTTMKAYFYLPGADLNSVSLSSGTAAMSTKYLTFTENNGLYSFSADISSDSSYKLSTGLAAGGVGTIKWTFNYTLDGESKTVYAYTTCYAPYQGAVAGIAASTSSKNGYYKHSASWTAIWGFHEVLNSQNPMYLSGIVGNGDGNYNQIDATAVYKYTLANCKTTPNNYEGGAAPTTGNLLASDDGATNSSGTSGTTYYYKSSNSTADAQVYVSGGTGLITFDPSRVSTLGDIPNFYFGAYFGSFGGNGDDDKLVNVERNAGFQMIDASGNYVKTVKDYYLYPSTSGTDPGFQSVTKDSHRAKANDIPLSDGYRFISATYQKWINKTSVGGNGSSVQANACANVLFRAVDKSELRDKVAEALRLEAEGKDLNGVIADASLVLGDPTASNSEVIQAKSVIDAALMKANQGDYIYSAASFLAPEIVYLKPADRKTFQYFVNDCNSSYTQSIEAKSNEGTGYLVFEGPADATILSLTCTGATINGKSAGTNLTESGGGFTINGNKVSGTITASTSSLPTAASTEMTSTLIKWTVTYTIDQPGRTVEQTATAYTECFAPLSLSVGTSLEDDLDNVGGWPSSNNKRGIIWYTTWISGVHEIYHLDTNKDNNKDPYWYSEERSPDLTVKKGYYDLLSEPMLGQAAKKQDRTTWRGQQNSALLVNNNSVPNLDYYFYAFYNNSGSNDTRVNMGGNIAGKIYVDTSRYNQYGQIPNLDVGTDVHNITTEMNDHMAYFGYEISGAYNKNTYCIREGFTAPSSIPNQYLAMANGQSESSIEGLHGQRKTAKTNSNMNIAINNTYEHLSAISAFKLRVQNGSASGKQKNLDACVTTYADFIYTDKSNLRSKYLYEISSGKQEAYYTPASWSTYKTALENLAVNLETVNAVADNDLVTAVETAADNLVLKNTTVTYKYVCTNDNSSVMDDVTMEIPYCSDISYTAPVDFDAYDYSGYTVKYDNGAESALNTSAEFSTNYSTYNSITVTFKYTYKTFTLTVDPNGGTYSGSTSFTQQYNTTVNLTQPTAPEGYHFDSWVVTGGGSLSGNTYTFGTSDGTATATWAPNTYKIGYDNMFFSEGHNFGGQTNGTVHIDFTSNGSNSEASIQDSEFTPVEPGETYLVGADMTFTKAAGDHNPSGQIYFFFYDANGNAITPEHTDDAKQSVLKDGIATTSNTPGFTENGYHYVTYTIPDGCYKVKIRFDCDIHNAIAGDSGSAEYSNIRFVKWDDCMKDIDYGDTSSTAAVTYNRDVPGISAPTRDGYVFEGYYTEPNGEGYKYYNADGTSTGVWLETQNTTVYSNWVKVANDDVFVLDASGSVYLNVLDNDAIGAALTGVSGVPAGAAAAIENGKIKFTPGTLINGTVSFTYTVTLSDGNTGSATVKVIPATSIYFEESGGFVTFNGAWTEDKGKDGEEIEEIIAEAHAPGSATYGELGGMYTSGNSSYHSMGTAKKYTVGMTNINKNGTDNAQFTFTGTGFEVYSITNNDCGYFEIDVTGTKENEKGEKLVDLALFDNNYYGYSYGKLYLKDGQITHDTTGTPLYKTTADDKSAGTIPFEDGRLTTNKPSGASQASGWTPVNNTETTEGLYQIPVISVKNLAYDTYTVKITPKYSPIQDMLYRQGSTDYSFWFDSVKIFDPIDPETITEGSDIYNAYSKDNELFAGSQKIRNILIDKTNAVVDEDEGIGFLTVFDGSNAEKPGVIGTMADIAEYKKVGPNNEVYLEPGKAIGFNITTASSTLPAKVSVGVKMIKPETEGKLTVNGSQEINVSIPTELYREITGINWKLRDGVYTTTSPIVIRNASTDNVIISLTDIRWSYGETPAAASLKAPLRFSFDPNTVTAFASQIAQESAKAASTVEYEGVSIEWTKNEVELGERVSLVITAPEEIVKVTLDGRELSNFEILEDGSKRWTYSVDTNELGSMEYDVVLYDGKGFNSKSLPTGVCKVVEPKVDIADAVISWDKSEISLGETATLSVETSQKIFAVTIGEERITEYTIKDGRKVFALSFTPSELGKYKYTVILEEYHGYTSTSVKSDALTVIGYTVSTDDIDIQWKSGTVETGAEAELIIRTPADIVKVIVDGHELTESKTLESGEKQWTYAVTVEQTGELEYSIRFIDENGMESSSVSTGALKVEIPAEEPGDNKDDDGKQDEEKLTFWQKLIRFFRNLFSKIVTVVKGLVK